MNEYETFALQYAVASVYNKLYKTDEYNMWLSVEDFLEKIGCLEVVRSALRGRCTEKKSDAAVEQIIQNSDMDREMCEKIKHSCGLRRMIRSEFHDALITNVQFHSNNLELTLKLSWGRIIKGVSYGTVVKLTFENVSDFTFNRNEDALMGLNVSRHYESIVDGKISIVLALWNYQISNPTQAYLFSLCCDDLQIEQILVED